MNAVPPTVNEDHLRLLLREQHESEVLDYKRELDLVGGSKKRAIVETAKDVAAMASGRGGHIVVGGDGRGQPTGRVTSEHAAQLDEARLRPRLERYLPDGLLIRTAAHEIDGNILVLIHVSPHEDGLVIMKDGTKYVSSVVNGGVSRIRPNRPAELIAQNIPNPASMCYDPDANQLVIPMNANNALAFIKLR